jgi:DNA-3-methyladenine glycosylase
MFLLYGIHWAFNVVVARAGVPHAVLVRAVEPLLGVELMASRRGMPARTKMLTNGPGKLCAAMGLNKTHYGEDLCGPRLFVLEGATHGVAASARINVDYAGTWAEKPWRFYERGNAYVSVPPRD